MFRKVVILLVVTALLVTSCRPSGEASSIQRVESEGRGVTITAGEQDMVVILDPNNEFDASGVEVATLDLGDVVLVETVDPLGRYLPSARFVSKTGGGLQQVHAIQAPLDLEWGTAMSETEVNIEPLMRKSLGKRALPSLGELLTPEKFPNGVNMVLAYPEEVQEDSEVEVYETPLSNTVLLVPEGATSLKAPGLAAPKKILFMTVVVVAYTAVLVVGMVAPLVLYIHAQQHATVPNLVGKDLDYVQEQENESALTKGRMGFDFQFDFVDTKCDDPSRTGEIVHQEPQPGTEINVFDDAITVYVCSETARVTIQPESTATPTAAPTKQKTAVPLTPSDCPTVGPGTTVHVGENHEDLLWPDLETARSAYGNPNLSTEPSVVVPQGERMYVVQQTCYGFAKVWTNSEGKQKDCWWEGTLLEYEGATGWDFGQWCLED